MKAVDKKIDLNYLKSKTTSKYPKQKWIIFCEILLNKGCDLYLYEAKKTFSKYITVVYGDKKLKVRFSNHKPIYQREVNNDCDIFVGVSHNQITTTEQALVRIFNWIEYNGNRT